MKKLSSITKAILLTGFLAIVAMGVMPATSEAAPGDITILCDGSNNLCAVVDDFWYFYYGSAVAVIFE